MLEFDSSARTRDSSREFRGIEASVVFRRKGLMRQGREACSIEGTQVERSSKLDVLPIVDESQFAT